jgi:hypothetical protein
MTKAIHNINLNALSNPNKEDADTQLVTLINHFLTGGPPITVLTAIQWYGIYAASQRIGQLIALGFPIIKEWITLPNGKRIMSYTM